MRGQILEILTALNQANVRYLVVGGVAVVLHGVLRTTLDLDLVLHLERSNVERAMKTLDALSFQPRVPVPINAFSDPEIRNSWIQEKNMMVFSLWHPADPSFAIDLFVKEPFDFSMAYDRALRTPIAETSVNVVALEDLIEMKRGTGRSKDAEDIRNLLDLKNDETN